jgi:leader peptidase (prepilin peptidase) / N-methyltransferase
MYPMWAAVGAVGALPAATVLRGQVARLSVPAGQPEELCCRNCAAPLPGLPAVACSQCGNWFGAPLAIELTGAVVSGLLLARFGPQTVSAAFAYLGVLAVALTQIDVTVQRLPDRLTLTAYPALVILLALSAMTGAGSRPFVRALLAGPGLAACYLLLGLLSRGQLGGGDVKLAALIGLVLGWLGWRTLVLGAAVGFVLAAFAGLAMLATRRAAMRTLISFGPYMLWGAFLAIFMAKP